MQTTELPSAVCREAFPAHPRFPQLKIASDPGLMLEIFRRHLKPVTGKRYQVQECTPVRFRYGKDGSRCVLQYLLGLVETDSGRHCHPWVTSMIYAERSRMEKVWDELKTAHPLRQIPETLRTLQPLSLIPDLQMLVQVFPYDWRLPTLPLIMSGPSPELQERLLASFGPGGWRIEEQTVEPLRYRTEMGGVVRYTLHVRDAAASRTQTKRFYVKAYHVYHSQHGERTCELLQQLCGQAGAARNDFTVVKPVVYCRERHCLVLEDAPGRSLEEVLLSGGDAISAARRVARAVAAFNQSNIPAMRRRSPQEQIGYLTRAAGLLQWACPGSSALIDEIVNQVSADLVEVPCVPIHWDLKTDHIFLDAARVTFVDLDTVSLGDPARDPAHLSAHIACRIGLSAVPPERARAVARSFVKEYFAQVPTHWRERLAVQYAIAAVESACGIFKRQEPQWPEKVTLCIDEAQQALAGGFR